jgi:hypothetical protein
MYKRLILVYFVFIASDAFTQVSNANSDFVKNAESYAIAAYHEYTGKQSRLNNGIQEFGYLNTIKGHAYYITDKFQTGSLIYDGIQYDSVQMLYDNYKDYLVILTYSRLRLILLREKIKSFDLPGHHFKYHRYDSLAASSLPTGFYDHLYDGKLSVLAKRSKIFKEKVTDQVDQEFEEVDHYIIYRDGHYYRFNSYKGFLNNFSGKSKDIRKYLKKHGIEYRKDRENAILKAVAYYETLN